MSEPLTTAQAVKDAAVKILEDAAQDWRRIRDPGMANNAQSYANKIKALPIATDDRDEKIRRLEGTLRYIAAQARANHPGALAVIQANAESALRDDSVQKRTISALTGGK